MSSSKKRGRPAKENSEPSAKKKVKGAADLTLF